MRGDHGEVPLLDRHVDRLAHDAARMVHGGQHVVQLREVLEVLHRRVAPAALDVVDEGRAEGRAEQGISAADGDRAVRVAGMLPEGFGRRSLDDLPAHAGLETDPLILYISTGFPKDFKDFRVVPELHSGLFKY